MTGNTSIDIAANAMVLLGAEPITSFTDGSAESTIAKHLYQTTYHALLTETLWHFATRSAKLAKLTSVPVDTRYTSKFRLPTDCLYVVKTDTKDYEIFESDIHSNGDTLMIDYIYPVNEINLPPHFAKALEYKLAANFAVPLTGNVSRADFYNNLHLDEIRKARRADASQRPATQLGGTELLATRR